MIEGKIIALRQDIAKMALKIGRDPDSVLLVVVTKNASVGQVLEAYHAGARHFAESRLPEAIEKINALPKDIIWHFIGRLQSKQLAKIVLHFPWIHSVASWEKAEQLSKAALCIGKRPFCFLQVNTSQEPNKQGFLDPGEYRIFPGIEIVGLMTMGPASQDPQKTRACFASLRKLQTRWQAEEGESCVPYLSMGMSSDYHIAMEEGATHLRIGSLIFSKEELS